MACTALAAQYPEALCDAIVSDFGGRDRLRIPNGLPDVQAQLRGEVRGQRPDDGQLAGIPPTFILNCCHCILDFCNATAKDMGLNQNGYRTSGNVPTQHRTGVRPLL